MFQRREASDEEVFKLFEYIPLAAAVSDTVGLDRKGISIPGVVLAGGAVRSLFDIEEIISDYDFFFTKNGCLTFKENVEASRQMLREAGFEETYACPKGWLYTYQKQVDTPIILGKLIKVQIICEKEYESVEDLLDSFDLTVAQFAIDFTNIVYFTEQGVKDVQEKKLRIHKISYPVSTYKRILKYIVFKNYKAGDIGKQFVEYIVKRARWETAIEIHNQEPLQNSIFTADAMRQYID